MMKKTLSSLLAPDHLTLLKVLPFGTGYVVDDLDESLADEGMLTLAMALQAVNTYTDSIGHLRETPIN